MITHRISRLVLSSAAAALISGSASGAVVYTFGTSNNLNFTPNPSTTAVVTIGSIVDSVGTGTFTTTAGTGSAGVSFDLRITGTSGNPQLQTAALGVSGGAANAGIDNDGGSGPQETITLELINVTGLASGETLLMTAITLAFGSTPETYTIDGGSNINFTTSTEDVDIPDTASVTIGAGSSGATAFAIQAMTVEVIPEPSVALLGGFGILALLRRRR